MGGAPGELAPLGRLKFRGHMLRILLKPDCLPSYHQVGCRKGSRTGCLKVELPLPVHCRLSGLAVLVPVAHCVWGRLLSEACLPAIQPEMAAGKAAFIQGRVLKAVMV